MMGLYVATTEGKQAFREEGNWFSWTLCRNIAGVPGGIIVAPKGGGWRLVAFWCEARKVVRAGFGATEEERRAIANFRLVQSDAIRCPAGDLQGWEEAGR